MHQYLGLLNGFGVLSYKIQATHVFDLSRIRIRLPTFDVIDPGHDVLI